MPWFEAYSPPRDDILSGDVLLAMIAAGAPSSMAEKRRASSLGGRVRMDVSAASHRLITVSSALPYGRVERIRVL